MTQTLPTRPELSEEAQPAQERRGHPVLRRTAPRLFRDVPVERRPALVEADHLLYGVVVGASARPRPRR
ncbi:MULTISPECIES: hypothetical protein [unclassified Nonomuraea]|uniref:hypothetical protein n=1 Tax=unclassified Nonomuraea TaxID=2593643 RepID=UPI00340E4D5F